MPLKPVVFVPGFPASELVRRGSGRTIFPPEPSDLVNDTRRDTLIALLCAAGTNGDQLAAGQPIRDVWTIAKQAQSLYDLLREYGYTVGTGDNFRGVGWDWRRGVDEPVVLGDVANRITELSTRNGGAPVVVIVHSTGGLVLRALLESRPALAAKIEHVLAFGVPWAGTLKAVRYVVEGDKFGFPPFSLRKSEVRTVMRHAQAAYDLFPPDPAATDLTDVAGKRLGLFVDGQGAQIAPLRRLEWAGSTVETAVATRAASAHSRLGARTSRIVLGGQLTPPITNVVGWGATTEVSCKMDTRGGLTFREGKDGDGTVSRASASWLRGDRVRTFFVPIGAFPDAAIPGIHSRIWDSPPLLELFDQILSAKAPDPFVCGCVDFDEAKNQSSRITLRYSAADAGGRPLPNAEVVLPDFVPDRHPFQGAVTREISLKRPRRKANVGTRFFRFVTEVRWTGGAKQIPILIEL